MNRRIVLRVVAVSLTFLITTTLNLGHLSSQPIQSTDEPKTESTGDDQLSQKEKEKEGKVKIYFLEIVTPETEAACALYSKMYGVTFGDAIPKLGGARTAKLEGGGMLSVRGPLRKSEKPVVRPYVLVEDIKKAVANATEGGAVVAMAPTPIKGYGQFAIVIHGGIESGLWQTE